MKILFVGIGTLAVLLAINLAAQENKKDDEQLLGLCVIKKKQDIVVKKRMKI
jgi:hypothetical protein